jgi:4-amino-4-deoxy-L-arabinose transferase-like glycosyltransferase
MSTDCGLPVRAPARPFLQQWMGRLRPAPAAAAKPDAWSPARLAALAWAMPVLLALFALTLRVVPWLANYPLHRDEALYGAWARLIASGRDPLLLTAWVDKPPLAVYLMAGSLHIFGVSTWALRVPGMFAALLTTPVIYALTLRLCRASSDDQAISAHARRIAGLAALLFALSPFAILFAPTAFTDGWLTLFLLTAAWAALAGRPLWAGLALGLAVASKQQGVLAVPLVIGLLLLSPAYVGRRWTRVLGALALVLLGFALIFAPLMYWDSLRWAKRPSFWDRSLATYGGLTLAAPSTWPTRAAEWGGLLAYFYAYPAISAVVFVLAALGATNRVSLRTVTHLRLIPASLRRWFPLSPWRLFLLYIAGFIALHWLFTFQPWDRYLLPIVPLVAILAARGIVRVWLWNDAKDLEHATSLVSHIPALLLAVALGWSAWMGIGGHLPVGSDHGAYDGLDRVVAVLSSQPADTVIYHQSLGWFFDFYLFDDHQERRWWGTPWKLADDAGATARREPLRPQWLVLTAWEDAAADDARLALAARGLALVPQEIIYRADGSRSFLLYRILPTNLSPRKHATP